MVPCAPIQDMKAEATTLAVGYPIGLIVDGEKGNTVKYAKEGGFHLKNIIFAGMGVIGTDKNKADNWLDGWTNFDPQNTVY